MEEEEAARITNEIINFAQYAIKQAINQDEMFLTWAEVVDLYNHNAEILDEDPIELDDMK